VAVTNPLVLYPNPTHGQPVTLEVAGITTNTSIKVQVFTLAFRKVQDETVGVSPSAPWVVIQPVDRGNNLLANGVYYVVVTTPAKRSVLKLLVLR